jgi:LemA protein
MLSVFAMTFILFILAGLVVMGIGIYNGLVRLKNQVQRAWANIDVILKQRFDEIPQLIQVIEQYANYEAGLIQKIAEARSHYGQSKTVDEKIQASNEMSMALKGIFAIGEAYPELKANQQFLQLQSRVSQIEGMIADRRESYNEAVTNFNTRIEQFPDVFAARILNYQAQSLYQVSEAEKVAPSLKMNLPKFGQGA